MHIHQGILYSVDETDIKNGTFIFPSNVSIIGKDCFEYVKNLKTIIIPGKIVHIYDYAFYCFGEYS